MGHRSAPPCIWEGAREFCWLEVEKARNPTEESILDDCGTWLFLLGPKMQRIYATMAWKVSFKCIGKSTTGPNNSTSSRRSVWRGPGERRRRSRAGRIYR